MIVLDANLLLYAYDSASAEHRKARSWLENVFSGQEPIGLPWQTISAFLRVHTNSRLPGDRFTTDEAVHEIDRWMELPQVRLLAPGERHWGLFRQMLLQGQVRGPLVTDAELAALTIEYVGVLYTNDRDFARFPGLRWVNPLAG
ncbi:MAG: TA system VapC family ribonuclease toxin [Terracidiphilus sp.]